MSSVEGHSAVPLSLEHPAHIVSTLEAAETRSIEQIRRGDQAVFETVFKTYYPRLCRFLLRMVGSREVAEDLVQDLFLTIWTNRREWRPQASLKAYLYRAARNQAINYLKHQRVVRDWEEEARDHLGLASLLNEDFQSKQLEAAVQKAIESLPERCRLIFELHRHDGLKYAEIAQVLDLSVKTVETQMGRALKALRKLLVPYLSSIASLSFLKDTLS